MKSLIGIWLICTMLIGVTLPTVAMGSLTPEDFAQESWMKIIDYFDYVRNYTSTHNIPTPPNFANYHAYMYLVYINTSGLHLLYAGLINTTFGGLATFTLPMQNVMMNYKTANNSRDVLTASNFLMLMAFNETDQSLYPNSPDMNDNLWSSFSMGFDFTTYFSNVTWPALQSKASVIPLTHSDSLHWSWGLRYTNLTSVWWRTFISPTNHTYNSLPMALATYNELTFTYNLTISPDEHKATLTENHVIGRVRQLWHFWGWFILPLYNHYNSTGCYRYGKKISNETVYDFLQENQIMMSIVDFQTTVMLDHTTRSSMSNGANVTDADTNTALSNSSISTYSNDGEKLFDASFGTKETYKLYNYTADQNESVYNVYNATARTAKIAGFAKNTGLFVYQIQLMKFLPALVAHMHPQLYAKAEDSITNMTKANYFYLIGYPTYSGYKIEHDPILTLYLNTATAAPASGLEFLPTLLAIAIIAIAGLLVIVLLVLVLTRRKKPKESTQPPPTQ